MPTGMDLKVERIRSRVTVSALAECMGISRQRVSQVETMERPAPSMVTRYRDALQVASQRQNEPTDIEVTA